MKLYASLLLLAATLPAAELQRGQVTVAGREAPYVFAPTKVAAPLGVVLSTTADAALQAIEGKNWNLLIPQTVIAGDWGVKALEAMVAEVSKNQMVLTDHVYLIAAGNLSWMAFYAASRSPSLFAATLAYGGNPKPAIDSNRLFGANTANTPVLWANPEGNKELLGVLRTRLSAAGFQYRDLESLNEGLTWLGERKSEEYPSPTDCESGNPLFARCFWLEMTSFDASKRNDAFPTTRVDPGSGASLSIGPFGFDPAVAGPGIVIGWLPDDYKGPLQKGDRITAVDGKPLDNGGAYLLLMDTYREEKDVAVMMQRGKDRKRLETRIVLPKREETFTGRVQGQYLADSKEVLVGSRGVGSLKVWVPPQWEGAALNWNGETVARGVKPGCWSLGPGVSAKPCQ